MVKLRGKNSLILGILGSGLLVFLILTASKSDLKKKHVEVKVVEVEIQEVRITTETIRVPSFGTVTASKSVSVTPQVNGKVVYRNPNLIPGGRLAEGEELIRIESRDYNLAILGQRANVAQAELNLAREKGLKAAAEREWEMIGDEVVPTEEGRQLALRETQVASAQAGLDSAISGLKKARLTLSRTIIRAPFDSIVVNKAVDVGQVVSIQTVVATLIDSSSAWVEASVPIDNLRWIEIPGVNAEEGSTVEIRQNTDLGNDSVRKARVLRVLPEVDRQGKMAQLLIEVDNPFNTIQRDIVIEEQAAPVELPLLSGVYVELEIIGKQVSEVVVLPRRAIRENDRIWICTPENTLEFRPVKIIWSEKTRVFVRDKLQPGERVILSRIEVPLAGMKLKVVNPDSAAGGLIESKSTGRTSIESREY
jgi:RND family efflux transporter MFP subunit